MFPSNDIAIIIHVFYLDVWHEIENYLSKLEIEYNLFISIPENTNENLIIEIFKKRPKVNIFMTENRGRDVLPFLQIINIIGLDNYKYICKMHTKKTGDSPLGNVWRKLLYFDLIGSNTTVTDILNSFEINQDIGIITGKNTILDSHRYTYGNTQKLDFLAKKTNIIYNDYYLFPAGTMFWIRPELIAPIAKLFDNSELIFEDEEGQADNTMAHAIERFFGIISDVQNKKIVESPALYSKLTNTTLNEVASLVLSQQYVGTNVFHMQKQKIQARDERILELENLAQSLRLKNRLKHLFSDKVTPLIKKIAKIPQKIFTVLRVVKKNPFIIKKIFYYLKRGELKYLLAKVKEKSQNNLTESENFIEINKSQYFAPFDEKKYTLNEMSIDIIIPVYNGYEFLEKLFDSLEQHTNPSHRLIVVNDCSPDSKVKPYLLKRLKKHENALFIDHEINQGFLKSVNEAYSHVLGNFVLLNTDTEVPNFWLERLMYPIVHMKNIASTTPFTNSGEIASFPHFVADNKIFDNMNVNQLDEIFRNISANNFYEEVPTGVGFCMGINYNLSKEIGMFAENTFGKGYGEENDWCQRAILKGYKNILVPNLFVYHKHGGSFTSEEKQELLKVNALKLLERHPNYGHDVNTYIQKDPHKTLRQLLVLYAADKNIGTHLIFDHDLGGGANIYANQLTDKYVLDGKNTLIIRYDYYSHTFKILHHYKNYTFNFKITTFVDLQEFISSMHIKEIFLNNLVSYKELYPLLDYIHALSSKEETNLIIPIHDYFSLSPSYNLLNKEGKYSISDATDNYDMSRNMQEWRNFYQEEIDMFKWKDAWDELFDMSSEILCFSHSSKEILTTVYSNINENKINVIPHSVTDIKPLTLPNIQDNTTVTIGVLGAINFVKGSSIIKQMVQMIERDKLNINIVVIGEITERISSKHFQSTGKYKRDDLPNMIQKLQIDTFLIPSIWPETFSYTTQEIIMMNLPLIVFNLGAPAERVLKYPKGYIIEDISPESIISTIQNIKPLKNLN